MDEPNQHTLLFIQFEEANPMTRTYLDFRTLSDCIDGLVQIYEQTLIRQNIKAGVNPREELAYKLDDFVKYIDGLADLSVMVFQDVQKIYVPRGRQWIKSKIYLSLKRAAKIVEPEQQEAEEA